MDYHLLFSVLVTIFSLGLTLIGIPAQIVKNYREKRSGQPLITILIAMGFYASSIVLFALTKTYLPLAAFCIGFVMWSVTLGQYLAYRGNH
ncbi:MAG: hypothetical protein WD970_01980 [Patescibacteria group bacterium]